MADFPISMGSPVSVVDPTKFLKPTSNSNTEPSLTGSIDRVYSLQVSNDFTLSGLQSPIPVNFGQRPGGGQLWPRGVYNK
jgi:hypothetical protein